MIDKNKLIELVKSGKSRNEIAKIFSVHPITVSRHCKKYNLSILDYKYNLVGQKINKLTVIEKAIDYAKNNNLNNNTYWKCLCECGNITYVYTGNLRRGIPISCGCLITTDRVNSQHHSWKGYGEISGHFYKRLQAGAKKRGLLFDVTINELWNVFLKQNRLCAISGLEIKFAKNKKDLDKTTASLDRINSNRHYTLDNIQWVHKDINFMKYTFTQDKFIEYCKIIAGNN